MSDGSVEEYGHSKVSIQAMAAILFLITVVAPFMISFGTYDGVVQVTMAGMTWNFSLEESARFFWNPSFLIITLPLLSFKLAFVYWFYRVYKGEKRVSSAIRLGIVSELVILILVVPSWISSFRYSYSSVTFPLPLTLVAGLIMLRSRPPKETAKWMMNEGEKEWWSSSTASSSHDAERERVPPSEDHDDTWS